MEEGGRSEIRGGPPKSKLMKNWQAAVTVANDLETRSDICVSKSKFGGLFVPCAAQCHCSFLITTSDEHDTLMQNLVS